MRIPNFIDIRKPYRFLVSALLLAVIVFAAIGASVKMSWIKKPAPQTAAVISSALHSAGSNLGWTKGNAKQYAELNINHEFCELLGDITGRFNNIRRDIKRIERQGADATREKKQFNELLRTFNKVPTCQNCEYAISHIEPYKLE